MDLSHRAIFCYDFRLRCPDESLGFGGTKLERSGEPLTSSFTGRNPVGDPRATPAVAAFTAVFDSAAAPPSGPGLASRGAEYC